MSQKMRNFLIFMIVTSCLLAISISAFAEVGISETTVEERKELEEWFWSSYMWIPLIILSPIILLFGIFLLFIKLCADFLGSVCMILSSFDVVHIVNIFELLI